MHFPLGDQLDRAGMTRSAVPVVKPLVRSLIHR